MEDSLFLFPDRVYRFIMRVLRIWIGIGADMRLTHDEMDAVSAVRAAKHVATARKQRMQRSSTAGFLYFPPLFDEINTHELSTQPSLRMWQLMWQRYVQRYSDPEASDIVDLYYNFIAKVDEMGADLRVGFEDERSLAEFYMTCD